MNDQGHHSLDEFAIAKSYTLEIDELDFSPLDAFLSPNEKKINVKKSLPEIQKRVFIMHEIAHYISENYSAQNNPVTNYFISPTLNESLLDVFFKQKKRAEEYYRRYQDRFHNSDPDSEIDNTSEDYTQIGVRAKVINTRNRDVTLDRIKLENANSELQAWMITKTFYENRLKETKIFNNVEAIRFCIAKIFELGNSTLKIINGAREKDRKYLAALGIHVVQVPERSSAIIRKMMDDREQFFRQEELRWNQVREVALEQDSIILEKVAEQRKRFSYESIIDEYQAALIVGFSYIMRLFNIENLHSEIPTLLAISPFQVQEEGSHELTANAWMLPSTETTRTIYHILLEKLRPHNQEYWCLVPGLLHGRDIIIFRWHPALNSELVASVQRLVMLAGGEALEINRPKATAPMIVKTHEDRRGIYTHGEDEMVIDTSEIDRSKVNKIFMNVFKPRHAIWFSLSPALNSREVLRWFNTLKSDHPDISYYSYDEGKKVFSIKNEPNIPLEEQISVQVTEGKVVTLAWGSNVDDEKGRRLIDTLLSPEEKILDPLQVTEFDARWQYNIMLAYNHYLIIAEALYSNESVDLLYRSLVGKNELECFLRDNDIRIFFSLGFNRTLWVEVIGNTTKSEILENKFAKKPLEIRLRLEVENASIGNTPLTEKIWNHWIFSCSVFSEHVFPTIVLPIIDSLTKHKLLDNFLI